MNLAPVLTEHSAEWHRDKFAEFTYLKSLVGEPSPHMKVAGWLSQECDKMERFWRAGCYAAPYSVLTSEAIWREWSWYRVANHPDELRRWIHDNWQGFHIRRERRMVMLPELMADALLSYRWWMIHDMPYLPTAAVPGIYDMWWGSVMGLNGQRGVHSFGRYITIRLMEFFNRYCGVPLELQDVRSIGGDSPVRMLALLDPLNADLILEQAPGVAEASAEGLLKEVKNAAPDTNHYVLAAMLCEYRVAYEKRGQYPGRTLDQELAYQSSPRAEWWRGQGLHTDLWKAREALFPSVALGEHSGWTGIRDDLSAWLRDKGVNWSDINYIYPSGEPR